MHFKHRSDAKADVRIVGLCLAVSAMILTGFDSPAAGQNGDFSNEQGFAKRQSHSKALRRHLIRPKPFPAIAEPPLKNWIYIPAAPGTDFRTRVASGGDLNGDGFADVVVADAQPGIIGGRLLIFFGSKSGLQQTPAVASPAQGKTRPEFGKRVRFAGDVNNDGYDDLIVGDLNSVLSPDTSLALLLLGGKGPFASTQVLSVRADALPIGDVNGDGCDDLAAGNGNQVAIFYGSVSGPKLEPDVVIGEEQEHSEFGFDVTCAGDVNGDGTEDLLISADKFNGRYRDGGKVYLHLGSAAGINPVAIWSAEYNLPVLAGVDDPHEQFFGRGISSAGDVNGDHFDDVIIGACFAERGDRNEGLVFVFFGSPSGLHTKPDWVVESNHAHSLLGQSVAAAFDLNGDHFDDIIVGAPGAANGQVAEGAAVVYYGSKRGLSSLPDWSLESDHSNERLGTIVASAGDINGDGFCDLLTVGPDYSEYQGSGLVTLGRVVVAFGGPSGILASHQWRLDKPFLLGLQQSWDQYHKKFGSLVLWAPALLILSMLCCSFVIIQMRLRRRITALLEDNRKLILAEERSRLARDVHDHLGAQLTQIALWTDIARSSSGNPEALSEKLERVSGIAKSAVADVSRLVWTMNPVNDTLENFAAYLADFAVEFLTLAKIEPVLDLPEMIPPLSMRSEQRGHVLAAVREALNNAVRHAQASQVTVQMRVEGEQVLLSIRDNGRGFNTGSAENNSGNGLRNIRQRIVELGGLCRIDSTLGQGTNVHIQMKLARPAASSNR